MDKRKRRVAKQRQMNILFEDYSERFGVQLKKSDFKKLTYAEYVKLRDRLKEEQHFVGYQHEYFNGRYVCWYDPEYLDMGWIWSFDEFKNEKDNTKLSRHLKENALESLKLYLKDKNTAFYIELDDFLDEEEYGRKYKTIIIIENFDYLKDGFESCNFIFSLSK